jgi:translation initiation factor 1
VPDKNSRLVYSTDGTHVDDRSRSPASKQSPRQQAGSRQTAAKQQPPADGFVRVQRTRKGHRGKTVTIVTGVTGSERELDDLLKVLKQHCGAGGARDGTMLEIQGDHRERLQAKLEALGHRVKLAGG